MRLYRWGRHVQYRRLRPARPRLGADAAPLRRGGSAAAQRLAGGARFVIRYDHRDTGQSVSYEPGAPGYSMPHLAADAIGVLDAFGVGSAHLIGRSMGGGLAMHAALEHPERVASLTLVATSPGGDDLPPMSPEFLSHVSGPGPDWSDRDAVVDHIIGMLRIFAAGTAHFDEAVMRDLVATELDRTTNVVSSQVNHFAMDVGDPIRERIGQISVPTLIIHGDADPVFPLGHAHALEREIPGARLVVMERTGHELPPARWDLVVPATLAHTAG